MGEMTTRIRKFFRFTLEEQKNIFVIVLLMGFIMGFDDGSAEFVMARWVMNFVGSVLTVAVGFLLHVTIRKVFGIINGIRTEQQISWFGLGAGLIIALISGGTIQIYLPGGFRAFHTSTLRLGTFRGGLNTVTLGWVALSGPVGSIIVAMMAKWILFQIMGIEALWLDNFIFFNFLLAFYTMLPIPNNAGLMVFFGSRLWYAVGFGTIIGYVVLFMMGVLSLFGALSIGFLVWLMYYIFFEKSQW